MIRRQIGSKRTTDRKVLRLAAETLRQGGVILTPTDTIYGLSCDPFNQEALEKLLEIKNRPEAKGFLLLVSSVGQARELASSVPPLFETLAGNCWPGPVTMLLQGNTTLPQVLLGDSGKIGCRLPRSDLLQALLQEYGSPLVSTSANLSGQPPPGSTTELCGMFEKEVDLFLDAGDYGVNTPSTVIDLTANPVRVVREGAGLETVLRVLQDGLGAGCGRAGI